MKQYWFNFDGDNWIADWTHTTVGQVYGGSNFYGTFFHGDPLYIYGIHWLPTSEYLTSYGFDKQDAANLYQGLVTDVAVEQAKREDKVNGPDDDWQHITYPIQSLSNPDAVLAKWDFSKQSKTEGFNTYWFINSMKSLGGRTQTIWATGGASATVYEKDGVYQALVWNPTDDPITVQFRNESGVVGSTTVAAKLLVKVDPTKVTTPTAPDKPDKPTDPTDPEEPDKPQITQKIEAESYTAMNGVALEECALGGQDVGWIDAGDWMDYQVTIPTSGTYTIKANVAATADSILLLQQAGNTLAQMNIPTTGGWQIWTEVTGDKEFWLEEGTYNIRLYAQTAGFNVDWIQLQTSTGSTSTNPDPVYGTVNLALSKTAVASGAEYDIMGATNVTDGDEITRWSSNFSDDAWIYVDLGQNQNIGKVELSWEAAYATSYELQVSTDGTNWTKVYETSNGVGGVESITFAPVLARYVRMQGRTRALPYGYSIYEFRVFAAK